MGKLTAHDMTQLGEELARRAGELRTLVTREAALGAATDYAERAGTTVTDTADEASADVLNDTEHVMHSHHLTELAEIEAARQRLASGDYGSCNTCGEMIDARRLRANPTAARCLSCQTRHEREEGAGAPHRL